MKFGSIKNQKIAIGEYVKTDYGQGKVLAVTDQWLIHDNSIDAAPGQFAILLSDDYYERI